MQQKFYKSNITVIIQRIQFCLLFKMQNNLIRYLVKLHGNNIVIIQIIKELKLKSNPQV